METHLVGWIVWDGLPGVLQARFPVHHPGKGGAVWNRRLQGHWRAREVTVCSLQAPYMPTLLWTLQGKRACSQLSTWALTTLKSGGIWFSPLSSERRNASLEVLQWLSGAQSWL